jgi:predicted kinase
MRQMPLTLIMLAGLPGTGKSTVAHLVARELGWVVLDKDIVNTVLLESGLSQTEAGQLAYEITLRIAEDLLTRQNLSLIVDTAGRHPFLLLRLKAMTEAANADFKVIRFSAPVAVRSARLVQRKALPSQWTYDQTVEGDEQRWYAHLPPDTLTVDAAQPARQTAQLILAFIGHQDV